MLSARAGRGSEIFIGATQGYFDAELTPELVAAAVPAILEQSNHATPATAMAEVAMKLGRPLG